MGIGGSFGTILDRGEGGQVAVAYSLPMRPESLSHVTMHARVYIRWGKRHKFVPAVFWAPRPMSLLNKQHDKTVHFNF
jgi:hypothetical protein